MGSYDMAEKWCQSRFGFCKKSALSPHPCLLKVEMAYCVGSDISRVVFVGEYGPRLSQVSRSKHNFCVLCLADDT
jgi:hypothetical protein